MNLLICSGIHDPKLTENFLAELRQITATIPDHPIQRISPLIFPAQEKPVYSPLHVLQFLDNNPVSADIKSLLQEPLVIISFSAGVVGAIGTAWAWQQQMGGQIGALIALDGWGVPLYGDFPIHRISHDFFTHESSALLGAGSESFYADPPVEHLDLWRSPQTAVGWQVNSSTANASIPTTAAQFLSTLLQRYSLL